MKGSPILSTITATLLMAGAYLWLHLTLYSAVSATEHTSQMQNGNHQLAQQDSSPKNMITCFIEAHFSNPPKKFTISDPTSGKVIVSLTNLTDNEWSGEIMVIKADSAELNIQAIWTEKNLDELPHQNFIQLVLSPDQMEDSSVTLRNESGIDTTATFQLRK